MIENRLPTTIWRKEKKLTVPTWFDDFTSSLFSTLRLVYVGPLTPEEKYAIGSKWRRCLDFKAGCFPRQILSKKRGMKQTKAAEPLNELGRRQKIAKTQETTNWIQ